VARKARQLVLGALVAMLVACGGGATDGCSNLDPTHSTDLAICRAAVVTGTGTATRTVPDSQSYNRYSQYDDFRRAGQLPGQFIAANIAGIGQHVRQQQSNFMVSHSAMQPLQPLS